VIERVRLGAFVELLLNENRPCGLSLGCLNSRCVTAGCVSTFPDKPVTEFCKFNIVS